MPKNIMRFMDEILPYMLPKKLRALTIKREIDYIIQFEVQAPE